MTDSRIESERAFHDERFAGERSRAKVRKYYSVMNGANEYYRNIVSRYCGGKRLLEYGCGTGSNSGVWARSGAVITGIDISPAGISRAGERAAREAFDAEYHVMNAEKTSFEDATFDIVVGSGILHHLNLENSFKELARILKEDGRAIFSEPLGHNPLINLYRRSTRSMRTEHEKPLSMKDVELAKRHFADVDAVYFNLFTLLAVPFSNTVLFKGMLRLLETADRTFMRVLPFLRRYAWVVVLHLRRPVK